MKLKATMAVLATTVLMGCQSTSKPIEPRPFTNEHSYAYNIANQTLLTRNNSPLKDFTPEEIEDARTKMVKASGAEASVVLGGISMLTGSLIGIINVAGGAAGALAHSDHEAAKSRFIIVLPQDSFSSKQEAMEYIVEKTHRAAFEAFAKYGEVKEESKGGYSLLYINGNPIGVLTKETYQDAYLQEREVDINGNKSLVYTYGVENDHRKWNNTLVMPPSPLIASIGGEQSIDYSEFFKSYTELLPKGFYIYTPSFPVAKDGTYTYSDYTQIVPAIYTQGEKYEFIKPQ